MHPPSSVLTATLRALHGETDGPIVAPALGDWQFAHVLAFAPGVDPVISALGALASELPDLLACAERNSSDLSAAIASLIGTDAGQHVLPTWTEVAPVGWGASHAAALIDAVRRTRCPGGAAGALIGPTNDAAALLTCPDDIAHAVRRWGQAIPNDPTAWMDDLASAERDRLVHALRTAPNNAAACWPWLPDAIAVDIIGRIDGRFLPSALAAYAAASSVVHARHAAILSALMHRARRDDLIELTRLAVASRMDVAWTAIMRLLRTDARSAVHVVGATPWNNLHAKGQTTILSVADHNAVCAAIAYARGMRSDPPAITQKTARAFFAAVTPEVWGALMEEEKRTWLSRLDQAHAHLAVRSLGPDPTFLARAYLNADVIAAVRCHPHDDATVSRMLLPIAVRNLSAAVVPAIVAALPLPPDPATFVQIAGRMQELSPALRDWITMHPTPQALTGTMTTLLLGASSRKRKAIPLPDRCSMLTLAFAGWSSEEATALLAALPDAARAAFRPDSDALAQRLAHPDRRDAFPRALESLAALSPAAALPAFHALGALATSDPVRRYQASACLVQALRDHEDCFLAIVDTLTVDYQVSVFLALDDTTCATALPTFAAIDPLVVHRLAHALQSQSPTAVLDVLATMPSDALMRIWRLMPETLQSTVLGDRDALLREVAAPGHADALAQRLQAWEADDPPSLLALRMLIDNDEARRARGTAILAQHPNMAALLLPLLHDDVRTELESVPTIAVAGADLPLDQSKTPALVRRRR